MKRVVAFAVLALLACQPPQYRDPAAGEIAYLPTIPTSLPAAIAAPPYTGSDPFVLQAQATYVTGMDLHQKLVLRTCGGVNGVCHNTKEYPDLHTLATFSQSIRAPCNVQPGTFDAVFDRCEQPGDQLILDDDAPIEIGWYEYIQGAAADYGGGGTNPAAPDASSPGMHFYLKDPIPGNQQRRFGGASFVRRVLDQNGITHEFTVTSFTTGWWVLGDRRHLFGEIRDYQSDDLQVVLDADLQQGDENRNSVYGASLGKMVSMLNPGKPEESYLVARLRGHLQGEPVPGTRMPLANQPPSVIDMLALMCFISGLDPYAEAYNLASGIDYENCSYSANPQSLSVVGQGITLSGRIGPLLSANCGQCHGSVAPAAGLDFVSAGLHARLLQMSTQQPAKAIVNPGVPVSSYLFLKLSGDGSITGKQMPIDLNGDPMPLAPIDVDAVSTWISAGALDD